MDLELNRDEIYVIDRFEGDIAICENRDTKEFVKIKRRELPKDIKEGSIIKKEKEKYIRDEKLEKEIAARIKEKMDSLWN